MAIQLKQGEAKPLLFTFTLDGAAVDVSTGTFSLCIKANKTDAECLISKADGVFDKSNAGDGLVAVWLDETDTDQTPKSNYIGELKTTIPPNIIDKSDDFQVTIIRSNH